MRDGATVANITDDLGITIRAERAASNPNMQDSADMDHWRVTLRCRATGRRLITYFSLGYGHNGKAPTAADVLECLRSDASSADQSFNEWCGDYGYSPDSRKAERTYKAAQRATRRLRTFLGDHFDAVLTADS